MNRFAIHAALAAAVAIAVPTAAFADASESLATGSAAAPSAVAISAGRMVYSAAGQRVAPVFRVNAEGNPQVIFKGELITIPSASLSEVNGKVTTSLRLN